MLGHLLAVLGQDVPQAEHVLVRGLVEHGGADRHQRVEPTPGLVGRLADEVGRVRLLERLLRALHVRVAPLRERHRAGVVPGVDHLGDATVGPLLTGPGEGDVVDERAVRVQVGQVTAGQLAELGARPDAHPLAGDVVDPDRQRSAPVAGTGQCPVDVVVQPVAVAAPLDRLRVPGGALVLAQQLVLDLRRPHVPGRLRVVHQRGVAAPAVRVGVLVVERTEQQPALGQVGQRGRVRILEELAADQLVLLVEVPVGTDRVDELDAMALGGAVVVLAERHRLVDQTGALAGRHVVLQHHEERRAGLLDHLERAPVGPALHVLAGEPVLDGPALTERGADVVLGDDDGAVPVGRGHVRDVGADGDGGVGEQRPRRGGPDHQVGAAGVRSGGQREADERGGVDDVLVALGQLVVRQRGPAAGAVRRDALVLGEHALVEQLLQRPPDRLDVRGVHRPVGVVQVHPVAHPVGELAEGADVAGDGLAALGVERLDAVLLDLRLAVDAELLLHGQLDRQAVAVPAGLALDVVALHRTEPREDVLEHPGLDVVGAGHPVGGRRALVEGPPRPPGGALLGPGEDVVGGPEVQDPVLHRRQVDLRRHCVVGALVVALLGGHRRAALRLADLCVRLNLLRHVRPSSIDPDRPGRRPSRRKGRADPRYHPSWRARRDGAHPLRSRRGRF